MIHKLDYAASRLNVTSHPYPLEKQVIR